MDGVGISIIGRPRPLPGHDTPNPAYHPHTLNYEEPLWLGDAFSGGYLTRNTPLGVDIVASGRFYGVNYVSFSFGALGTIIVVVICAD